MLRPSWASRACLCVLSPTYGISGRWSPNHQRRLWNLEDKLDTEADFVQCAICSTASCDDAEEEEPEVLEQVVAQATDSVTFALFSLWNQLKSWDAFLGHQDYLKIMKSTEPLEVGSDAPVLKHVNQVLHWRDAAKLCQ